MNLTSDGEWHQVPIRLDAERWATRSGCRRLLIVGHTVATVQRLLDAILPLVGEVRVQVFFTAAPDVFCNGVNEFLNELKGLVLPWQLATQTPFDLALASGYEGIHELHAPVVVLPHGAGHNKFVSDGQRGRAVGERGVYGLSRQWLLRDGVLIPEVIVLSHQEDLARLAQHCPEALPAAEVVGDPTYDRIKASLPLRALYRSALGADPGQRIVAVSSTWGPGSLLSQEWGLLERMAAELPSEQYRIVVLLHPNARSAHSEWQIRWWLAGLRGRGVALISPDSDICGALVAADYVVGDSGSVALYGAAAGVPVLMGGLPGSDLDPDSPVAELRSFVPRLDPGRSLLKQFAKISSGYQREAYAHVAARITSEPGRFMGNMRALIYRKLRLRPPTLCRDMEPARLPVLSWQSRPTSVAS